MNPTSLLRCLCVVLGIACALPAFAQSPAIPEEARKYFVRGETLIKDPKATPDDALQAATEFVEAARLAPAWPEARLNAALAFEITGDYANAIANLKLYQQFKLSETDARTVQDKLYALEVKQEKAAKDKESAAKKAAEEAQATREADRKTQEAIEVRKTTEKEDWLRKLDGARYSRSHPGDDGSTIFWVIDIKGKTLVERTNTYARREWGEDFRCEIAGREFVDGDRTFRIGEDAVTEIVRFSNNATRTYVYRRER